MDHYQLHNDNHTFWNWEGTPQVTSHPKPDQPVPGSAVIGAGCRWRGKKHGIAAGCCCQWPLHWRLRDLTKADLQVVGLSWGAEGMAGELGLVLVDPGLTF